jgi:hypothetical protein
MRIARGWLHTLNLLKLVIAGGVLIVAIAGTATAAGSLGSAAKKKCNRTCEETRLFDSLYNAKIGSARVAFAGVAATANNSTSADSARSASTAGAITGTVSGAQVSGPVASATTATDATNSATLTGTVNGTQVSGTVASASDATSASTAASIDGHTFTQINASAGSDDAATLLNSFGGLTLQCIAPAGTAGTVTLEIVNSSPTPGSFGAGEVSEAGTKFDQGTVLAAVGSTPTITTFTFPIQGGAQVSFSFEESVDNATSVVSGTFTLLLDNGCTAFGDADASSVAK